VRVCKQGELSFRKFKIRSTKFETNSKSEIQNAEIDHVEKSLRFEFLILNFLNSSYCSFGVLNAPRMKKPHSSRQVGRFLVLSGPSLFKISDALSSCRSQRM